MEQLDRAGGWMSWDEAIDTIATWLHNADDEEVIAEVFERVTGAKITQRIDNGLRYVIEEPNSERRQNNGGIED